MICVIDYGMGNLRSVSKALEKSGAKVLVSSEASDIERADKIVLPGVGAFGGGSEELQKRALFEPIRDGIAQKKPFLGICLGMQLLFEESEESPEVQGLAVFPGKVRRFQTSLKIPHMGWNEVKIRKKDSRAFKGIASKDFFYFVHSFYAVPQNPGIILGTTEYGGEEFASFVSEGPVWACQFHPEKSQDAGLQILKNFADL